MNKDLAGAEKALHLTIQLAFERAVHHYALGEFLHQHRPYIRVAANGTGPLGNTSHGIFITSFSASHSIGCTVTGADNRIAHHGGDGVLIGSDSSLGFASAAGSFNSVLGNRIFNNAGQGIDLGVLDSVDD